MGKQKSSSPQDGKEAERRLAEAKALLARIEAIIYKSKNNTEKR